MLVIGTRGLQCEYVFVCVSYVIAINGVRVIILVLVLLHASTLWVPFRYSSDLTPKSYPKAILKHRLGQHIHFILELSVRQQTPLTTGSIHCHCELLCTLLKNEYFDYKPP